MKIYSYYTITTQKYQRVFAAIPGEVHSGNYTQIVAICPGVFLRWIAFAVILTTLKTYENKICRDSLECNYPENHMQSEQMRKA